ncbi:MAG: gamma-glutamyltransferase family protein [Chloroflexota bacterium]|nr:gamma-glutamyltransferase family protein [Chloroflexota bacterium]
MHFDFSALSLPSVRRKPLFAAQGVVATSQALASQAGFSILKRGGNAVDAALAAAITLTVVEPCSCDVGGDLFAQVWDGQALHGLNGSGRAPAALTPEEVRKRGHEAMPDQGWLSVTVPGAPAAWRDLHQRFGRLPFAALFESAIEYAEKGYPISPTVFWHWRWGAEVTHADLHGEEYSGFETVFAPGGRIPQIGEMWRNPDLAHTLRRIAESGAQDFYNGEIAGKIAAFSARTGGVLTLSDLQDHSSTWVEPISTNYRGYDVWELPPNGQGLAALIALNILEGFELGKYPRESAESYHLQIEAMKLAFVDAQRYIADPERAPVPTRELLSKEYAARRRALIGEQALLPESGEPLRGGTVYLCAADADGMMVSLIQSNFDSFGSHVVVPGVGIALQNRGSAFSLDPAHLNRLEPGKRPFHTIIPGFLSRAGQAIGPFGVMGGHMQPQGHVQMIVNMLDYGMNPQASLDAPRWFWGEKLWVQVEPAVAPAIVEALTQRGHEMNVDDEVDFVGRGQIIWRLPSGVYVAGSEPRADGCAIGY